LSLIIIDSEDSQVADSRRGDVRDDEKHRGNEQEECAEEVDGAEGHLDGEFVAAA